MSRGSVAVVVSAAVALGACAERAPKPAAPPEETRAAPERAAPSSDGPISLRSKKSGRCLDVSHEEQGAVAPFWSKLGKSAFETKMQKEPGPLLQQWKCTYRVSQHFRLKRQLDGGVAIRSAATDLCLDAAAMPSEPGLIVQIPCNGSPEQSFRVERGADGTMTVISQRTGKCLQPAAGTWPEGGLIQQAACVGSEEQRWVVGP